MEILVLLGIGIFALILYWKSIKVDSGEEKQRLKGGSVIEGKAFVSDGDGIRVKGHRIRIADIDAPEKEQQAQLPDGRWVDEGKRVKSALIRKIGGKPVKVLVEGIDQYNRILGMVLHEEEDIGKWLVGKGYATAAYSNRYVADEAVAKEGRRGRWSYQQVFDPYDWRQGRTVFQKEKAARQEEPIEMPAVGEHEYGAGKKKGSGVALGFVAVLIMIILVIMLNGY